MKKSFIILGLIAILFVSACQPPQEDISSEIGSTTEPVIDSYPVAEPTDQKGELQMLNFVKSELARETNPNVDEDLIKTLANNNTAFALAFYDQIRNEEGNIIFSPFSISLALSMTLAGAEGSTEKGMLNALQIDLPETDLHPAFNALLLAIEESQNRSDSEMAGSHFQLNLANSIWGQTDLDLNTAFLDTLAKNYGAGLFAVDFKQNPNMARLAINDWVAEETGYKIEDLIPEGAINAFTRLVLANAIYFKGSWMHPFNENLTIDAPFYTIDGTEIIAKRMKLLGKDLIYKRGENYQAVSLPYLSSDFVMTLLVPDAGAFHEVEDQLDQAMLEAILSSLWTEKVDLEMPKFDFDTNIKANDPLIALGMGDAFNPDVADFSGITDDETLMITDVLHKAKVTVDEEGTEAAAATAVIIGLTSAMPEEPISLIIDRPFMFMIRHQPTNTILFMGRVTQP
ncbi:MAG: serpin family protein [Brevefilum fermentans]|jgi:serpin B|uniref:Proteinase inhibitor I4 serpin n=1 Tax=Candidatus Brevifilum fermentans TaxID=1986204 RepID=A0A1Y6K796_9CHLR|nr:serpin family protein [Brevefilum fermentans]MDI9565324.1 serpin family protein [Chloroflexota bacterium]SMX54459.1 Proteinase inhibitor I4 serpin [Brevefilum fermentans]